MSSGRGLLKLLAWAALIGLGVALFFVTKAEINDSTSTANQNAFGHLAALAVLFLFTVVVRVARGDLRGFVVGKDRRVSTSKLQASLWTYAIAGALMSLVAATWVGPDTGFDALTSDDFDFEPYLVLLGGPFAAAVLARMLVGAQVERGETAKPPGEPSLGQAASNDQGDADLIDSQYLLFNFVALAYFLGAFLQAPAEGFPDIPTLIYALTGASAAGYVSNKAVGGTKPRVTSVYPGRGPGGTEIEIFGLSLLYPREDGREIERGARRDFHPVRVMVGNLGAEVIENRLTHKKSGDDRLKARVPEQIPAGVYDVKVLNLHGIPSEPAKFEVTHRGQGRGGRIND